MSGSAHGACAVAERFAAGHWQFDFELKTRLLVMQPTPFCNISCDYCYLAHRNDKRRMSQEVVAATAQRLIDDNLLAESLGVVWHAGEPLTMPLEFYEAAFRTFATTVLFPSIAFWTAALHKETH